MMRAYELARWGLEHLNAKELPDPPEPEGCDVVVRVRAVSLNYRDTLVCAGSYNPKYPLPLVPCSDGAGDVIAIGPDVKRFRIGDRVMPIFSQSWLDGDPDEQTLRSSLGGPLHGTLREIMTVPEQALVRVPDSLGYAEAATLPCAALTAWSALVTYGLSTLAGASVLVLGTGGVSIFALQIAKAGGAQVIVTSGDHEKLERVKKMGADHVIHYREQPEWHRTVRELTSGRGVDLVIEVGGAGSLERSIKSVRPGGVVSLIGILGGKAGAIDLTPVLMRNVRVQGILVGHRAGFEAMCRAIEQNKIRPVIDQSYAFEEAPTAIEELSRGAHFGKLVIELP